MYTNRSKTIVLLFFLSTLIFSITSMQMVAQTNANCNEVNNTQSYSATAFFNYGSASGMYNSEVKSAITLGQSAVKLDMYSASYKSDYGFWSQLLLPPAAPAVVASEGNLGDRIEVKWSVSSVSPVVTDVFKVYRNGTYLDEVDKDERVYVDYNVVAGEFYTYSIQGVNESGIGVPGSAVGFLNPNGVITGQVTTVNGNPVADCIIDMSPTLGSSLRFNGDGTCFADYSPLYDTSKFSATLWVRQDSLNDAAGLLDLGSSINKNWWIHTMDAISGRGINVSTGGAGGSIDHVFPTESETDWHHIAVTYNGNTLLLYVDGNLIESMVAPMSTDSVPVYIGSTSESTGYYKGLLDEVIIYNKQLTQTEIRRQMNKSISSRVEGLVSYWKMDEGTGTTTYDLTANQNRLYMCGPKWSEDNSPITNSSLTDAEGYYILEGINYGSGETFTVRPSKKIYESISLEFNAANEQYAELTNFELTDTATISTTFNLFNLDIDQTIVSKGDLFNLSLINGELVLNVDGTDFNLGARGLGWHQFIVSLVQNGGSVDVTAYVNGIEVGSGSAGTTLSSWHIDPQVWALGASPNPWNSFFVGLIQEFIVYNGTLTIDKIQENNNTGTDKSNSKIYVNFPLNEAIGDSLYNISSSGGVGHTANATWANDSKHYNFTEHEFLPSSKLVSINSTNTSTDQVDFTDLSTIPVSGYVRYNNTNCFADSVEILVNGYSVTPPVFTDEDGYFIVELEPGSSAKLSPKFEGHKFSPAFYEVKSIASPVAGVLFLNKTTRIVEGQLAGGSCKKSIIPDGDSTTVKLFSKNNCYEKELVITNPNGKFKFENVPPIKLNIAVSGHSVQDIFNQLNNNGGESLDLTLKNDTIDFIYYSPPIIEITEFADTTCGLTLIEQFKSYDVKIDIVQDYFGETCPVDDATITVTNNLTQDNAIIDTFRTNGSLEYSFSAGPPNIAAPYIKTLDISATANGRPSSNVKEVIILGKRPRGVNFTSTTPAMPIMILHDPPGDNSYSYIRKGETKCTSFSFNSSTTNVLDRGITYSYGPDLNFSSGIGVTVETSLDVVADLNIQVTSKSTVNNSNSGELCVEFLTDYTTDDSEYLPGDTSDVYIGGALNLLFGITDILKLEDCSIVLDTGINVFPQGFESNYFYTEYEIRKNIIPNLISIGDFTSVQQWNNIIQKNKANKEDATLIENISFGSGVNIEKSRVDRATKTNSFTIETEVNESIGGELGLLLNGVGAVGNLSYDVSVGKSLSFASDSTSVTEIGYRLGDNDPGDLFTVNVLKDEVYGTPIFQTVSGVSSCPHEKNTVPRDEVSMTLTSPSIANNIRENEAAVFEFNLGNISQTEENREYIFSLRSSSNVNGAEVKIAGTDPLDTEYFIPFAESFPVTVSVERGPSSYTDTLIFDYFVQCEADRNVALGIPKSNTPFNKSIEVVVNFIEPCSSVDINNPLQDWVQTPADGLIRPISLFDYDVNDSDLELIRVQYRRSQGDGLWINIAEIPKADLGINSHTVDWDTDDLADGLYEIRALAVCVGGIDVGISHVIKGRIERTPPELFGTAEPADGVLSKGDEISITFNEPIQCNEVYLAAGIGANINNNNLGLYDTQTGNLVDFTMSCSEDKIILVPNVPNKFLENKVLRVELDSILDLVGNKSGHLDWEFTVDQNSLNWIDREDVKVIKYEEEVVQVTRRIENRGGFNIEWELENLPEWCTIFPTAGNLAPGDVQVITFEFDESMVFGNQLQTILLSGPEGDEPMVVDARVICPAPIWEVKASEWEYAMNITAVLNIEGDISTDEEDMLAAFVDDELRGVGKVQYYPAIDSHLVFLTIFSNSLDPDLIDMRIWDASSCLVFSPVVESFVFQSDDLIGTPTTPQHIHTSQSVLQEIELNGGWNWLSFNLDLDTPSPDSILNDINDPDNGIMKSQIEFAQYAEGFGWFGSLDSIGNSSSYQLRINEYDTLLINGDIIDPTTVDIPLAIGWNWIGYIPRSPLAIDEALADITVLDGDLVKSQTEFAQYVSGFGWIGTLKSLRPTEGYIIKTSLVDTLSYPEVAFNFKDDQNLLSQRFGLPDGWQINPAEYEHSMTMTAIVLGDGTNIVKENSVLAAFHEGKCRGLARAVWVEPKNSYMFFINCYSNIDGELFEYKLYDGSEVSALSEDNYFSINTQIGSVLNPHIFERLTTSVEETSEMYVELNPNPVELGQKVVLQGSGLSGNTLEASIIDINGAVVHKYNFDTVQGDLYATIPTRGLPAGVYQLALFNEHHSIIKKFIVVR